MSPTIISEERSTAEPARSRSDARRLRRFVVACIVAVTVAGSLTLTPSPAGSIVGGSFARITGHPHQVALVSPSGNQFCGGSIIGSSTVVTAAHCVERTGPSGVLVQAGNAHLFRGRVQIRNVQRIVRHPRYARQEVADIAVLQLARPLRFNRKVRPIELATAAELAAATHAIATGWGARFEENGRGSVRLRRVRVPIVGDRACNRALRDRGATILPRLELCAGAPGRDSCYGDSGGPLVIRTPDGPRLAGITSWGLEPCGGRTPGIYTEVPSLRRWIARHDIG
ncbi:MAG: S1 family peptidase [Acidimicrobiales bacterium]